MIFRRDLILDHSVRGPLTDCHPDADRSVDWLLDVLSDIGVGNETIEDISSLAMDRFHDVGLYCVGETVFVFILIHSDMLCISAISTLDWSQLPRSF